MRRRTGNRQNRSFRALGLFAAVWLNLALQPCAMALEKPATGDCPHCPPAAVEAHAHGGMHESTGQKAPCAERLGDCTLIEALNQDGRPGKLDLDKPAPDLPIAITRDDPVIQLPRQASCAASPEYRYRVAGSAPPLHVLYCVYLD